ncbi:pyridoxal phosphate-dependent aminotransferase [Anaerotignum lactatifermentans]|uniref:Aminotransferase n=1 Tax=Anaerotignum lactatifermentans TaxID=160404 RepID=A0ABS2G6A1_9FIRM|nr:pyridoxal phosphate-dependent aminotransferase [Anaerotignum lactatifermentans]MBM6828282.1 pyridoxal phosphate-dependent aminotransferase [Anaerotignum lactatifermentans]MBM6876555.1 pyridoxal phosphate-dependent aminotransferase [Anaerotignum lactatifermentans]MBM6949865.1 pyridoxal phosphate-dependent aminotransferase [Anaerotignum lactatifermentans]
MVSKKMKEMIERSAALGAMFTEGKRLKELYGEENVFDFGIGNPNVKAPDAVNEAIVEILREVDSLQIHGYTDGSGIPAARQAIAESLNRRFGTSFSAKNLIMTVGAAGGLSVICKVLIDEGDEALTFAPYFGEYDNYVINAGGTLLAVPPNPPSFLPDLAALEERITAKTKAIILNSPNNPTGVVYDAETIGALAAVLERKEKELGTSIYIIADEPYRELVYDGAEAPYIPLYYHNTIVAYSFSKSLSLPGDRIGYLVIPSEVDDFADVAAGAEIANRCLGFVNAPALQQMVVARCCDEQTDVAYYDKNRLLLYEALTSYGYACAKPQGAFYLFVKALEPDEEAFCEKAKKHGLLMTPGKAFRCPGYVRIAYCVARETIERSLPSFQALAQEYKN